MEFLIIFMLLVVLILLRIPVAFALGITSFVIILLEGYSLGLIAQRMFMQVNSFTLLAVPLFILVAQLMNTGGVSKKIFDFCRVWVGHIRGSLGHVNVLASMIFAGMSGSAVADTSGLGIIEIEAMNKEGYDKPFAAAITAASSTIGPIIPPSIPLVIYAVMAEQSVGKLFLGGLIPGIAMGIALMIGIYIVAAMKKFKMIDKASWNDRYITTIKALPALMTPIILLSGIIFGITTPSEAGVIAIVYALILGLIDKELNLKKIYDIMLETAKASSAILLIVASASIITWLVISSGVAYSFANLLLSLTTNKIYLLLLINAIILFLGCFMEGISIIIVMVPVLLPIINFLEINLIHFGVFLVLNMQIGIITPPFGLSLFIVSDIAKVPVEKVLKAMIPAFIALSLVLLLVVFIPEIVTWFPALVMGSV